MGNLSWTITKEDADERVISEIEYNVQYNIHGSYYAGNHENPPEYPEVEVEAIFDDKGKKLDEKEWETAGFCDSVIEAITEKALEDAAEDDGDYPEPDDGDCDLDRE